MNKDNIIIDAFIGNEKEIYYQMLENYGGYLQFDNIGHVCIHYVIDVLLKNNLKLTEIIINEYIDINPIKKSELFLYNSRNVNNYSRNLYTINNIYPFSENQIKKILTSKIINTKYLSLLVENFPNIIKIYKNKLISQGVYKPYLDNLTQKQFDNLILNKYCKFDYNDFLNIINNKIINEKHYTDYCNKDYKMGITIDDINIIVHFAKLYGLDYYKLRNIFNYIDDIFIVDIIEDNFPDEKNKIFMHMKNNSCKLKKINDISDKNVVLKSFGFFSYLNKNVLEYIKNVVPDNFEKIIHQGNNNINIYKYLIFTGFVPNQNTLEILCKQYQNCHTVEIFEELINKYKLVPNIKCMINLLNKIGNINNISSNNIRGHSIIKNDLISCDKIFYKIMEYKITIDEKIIKCAIENNLNKYIDIFLQNYLGNDKTILISAIENKIMIKDIEKYGFAYDDEFYNLCHMNNFMPDEYLEKFKKINKIYELRYLFSCKKLETIKLFMENNNLYPDTYCIDNTIFNLNENVYYYVFEKEFNFSIHCLNMFRLINKLRKERLIQRMTEVTDMIYNNKLTKYLTIEEMSKSFTTR